MLNLKIIIGLLLISGAVVCTSDESCLFYGCTCSNSNVNCISAVSLPLHGPNQILIIQKLTIRLSKRIEELPSNAFSGLTVDEIDLSDNNLKLVHDEAFIDTFGLAKLNLEDNKFNDIKNLEPIKDTIENINLNFNQLNTIPIFKNFNALKKLFLTGNQIKQISYVDAEFEWPQNLEFLNLADNFIEKINENDFQVMNKLKFLNLRSNKVNEIDGEDVFPSSLVNLDLSYNRLEKLDGGTLQNLLYLEELNLRNNRISLIDQSAFTGLKSLKLLNLEKNLIVELRERIFYQLNQATILLSEQKEPIEHIHNFAFERFSENNGRIILSRNEILRASSESFCFLNYYSKITAEFSDIVLRNIDPCIILTAFKNISTNNFYNFELFQDTWGHHCSCDTIRFFANLHLNFSISCKTSESSIVNFSLNSCTTGILPIKDVCSAVFSNTCVWDVAHVKCFYENPCCKLRKQTCDSGLLRILQLNNLTENIYQLHELNLSNSAIDRIEKSAFKNMNITVVRIEKNKQLKEFESHTFDGVYTIKILILNNNEISSWNSSLFTNMIHKPSELHLSGNKLISLEQIFDESLKLVDVSHNKISVIKIPYGSRWLSLINLNLSHNLIKHIPFKFFMRFTYLKYLNLSENYINSDGSTLIFPTSLQKLDLSRNFLHHIDAALFRNLSKLSFLDLSENSIEFIDNSAFKNLVSLKHLNLRRNQIKDIDFSNTSYLFPHSLQWLSLSNNLIKSIERFTSLSLLNNLSYLELSHNFINFIDDEALANLTRLEYLGLSKNYISFIFNTFFLRLNAEIHLTSQNTIIRADYENLFFERTKGTLDLSHNSIELIDYRSIEIDNFTNRGILLHNITFINLNPYLIISNTSGRSSQGLREITFQIDLETQLLNKNDYCVCHTITDLRLIGINAKVYCEQPTGDYSLYDNSNCHIS